LAVLPILTVFLQLFVVDILKEHIAVAEAKKLNIPTFAIVDTNSDPRQVDFAIPANDDASKSISLIIGSMVDAIEEGLLERKLDRDKKAADEEHEGKLKEPKKNSEQHLL
jgi:small subunit ribosomal protein S2